MTPLPFYKRLVDVMEEWAKFAWLMGDIKDHMADRYAARIETLEELFKRFDTAGV